MINSLIRLVLRHPGWVVLMGVALVIGGGYLAMQLPVDALPDITSLQCNINTHVDALAPEEVEKQITVPLERGLAGLPGLDNVRSTSQYGLSQITLTFKDDAPEAYLLRQAISERIAETQDLLPPGARPLLPPLSSGLGEIFYYQIRYKNGAAPKSKVDELTKLKITQDFEVTPWFLGVPGVSEVSTSGGYVNQVVIQPDSTKLQNSGLTLEDIANVVKQNVSNSGGGVVERAGQQVLVRILSRVQTVAEIENLALKYGAGSAPILIKDVAKVENSPAPRVGAAYVDGEEAVIGAVIMARGQNTRTVSAAVRQKLNAIESQLPPGMELVALYDRGELISKTVGTIEHNLLTGALLVVVVLLVFLGNIRAAIIVAVSIPLSLLIAMAGMVYFNITGNLISLGAIDFGLIVDGSVVMVENLLRYLAQRQHQLGRNLTAVERADCVQKACCEVGSSMVAGVGIITLVYVPIFALSGIPGRMFRPLAATVTMALAGALLLALTLIPALSVLVLTKPISEGKYFSWFGHVQAAYRPILRLAMRITWPLCLLAILVLGAAVEVDLQLGGEFIPHLDEGSTLLAIVRPASIGLDQALEFQRASEKLLKEKFPEVHLVYSRTGADDGSIDPMGINQSDTTVIYGAQGYGGIPKEELVKEMKDALDEVVPGQTMDCVQPIEDRFNDFFQGARTDVVVKIYGDDFDTLEKLGNQVQDIVKGVKGNADVTFDSFDRTPILEVKPIRNALALYGLQADDIGRAVSTAVGGEKLGSLLQGDLATDVMLRYGESNRLHADDLGQFRVRLPDGSVVSLEKLAQVDVHEEVNKIQREEGRRVASVPADVVGRDQAGFVADLRAQVQSKVTVPDGYMIDYAGQFRNLEAANARLWFIVPVVIVVILALIYVAFRNVVHVLLIATGIPLAVTGGIFALAIRDMPFSIPAAIGFIALMGIAVLNGIVLISYFNKLQAEGRTLWEAVVEGSATRLRPVLMTALVASLGLIPMAIANGPGWEVQRPLATVVIGGIISSTFLTLLLLPALYAKVSRRTG